MEVSIGREGSKVVLFLSSAVFRLWSDMLGIGCHDKPRMRYAAFSLHLHLRVKAQMSL